MRAQQPQLLVLGISGAAGPGLVSELTPRFKLQLKPPLEIISEPDESIVAWDAILLDAGSIPAGQRRAVLEPVLARLSILESGVRTVVCVPAEDRASAQVAAACGAWDVVDSTYATEVGERVAAAVRVRRLMTAMPTRRGATDAVDSGAESDGVLQACMLGGSPAVRRLLGQLERVAHSDVPVLITGESGTGKELAARLIHSSSVRASGPFVAINCGAIPENLLESELFGHERGAFTGASCSRRGRFEAAEGGTLLLDEIGELASGLQVKLLRFLEDHMVERVGSLRGKRVDVRVVAATNRDLAAAIAAGTFREDLYYRLAVFTVALPRLAERTGDALLLAGHFVARYGRELGRPGLGFSEDAIAALRHADWPGNVRELINRVRRGLIIAEGREITAADLGLAERAEGRVLPLREARSCAESRCIERALIRHGWRKRETARALSISRTRLYELMRSHGIPDRQML